MEQLTKGYCVLTETFGKWELVWRTEMGDKVYPQIFKTERDAQLEIIEDIEDDIQEFKDGEREYNEIHQFAEYLVATIEIYEDGTIMVWQEGERDNNSQSIIVTSLKKWRETL